MASTSDEPTGAPPGEDSDAAKPRGEDSRKRSKKSAAKKPAAAEPILSGRLLVVLALFAAMVFIPLSPLSALLTRKAPTATRTTEWKVGSEGTVHVTVVTADYNKLACAHPEPAGDYHCGNADPQKPWPAVDGAPLDDNKRQIIQPYRTTDGSLLLIAGLWAQPEVATRLHNEPPQAVAENKLARFVIECRVKFIAQWNEPFVRWAPGQKWDRQGNGAEGETKTAPVAEPQECRILERKRTS